VRLDHFFYYSARTAFVERKNYRLQDIQLKAFSFQASAFQVDSSNLIADSSLTLSGTIDDAPCRYLAGDAVEPQAAQFSLREATRPAGHFPGGHRRGVTPVPIPNTEVKLSTADGTAWVTVWESRSLPGLFLKGR
jgi:hypothetical protein